MASQFDAGEGLKALRSCCVEEMLTISREIGSLALTRGNIGSITDRAETVLRLGQALEFMKTLEARGLIRIPVSTASALSLMIFGAEVDSGSSRAQIYTDRFIESYPVLLRAALVHVAIM